MLYQLTFSLPHGPRANPSRYTRIAAVVAESDVHAVERAQVDDLLRGLPLLEVLAIESGVLVLKR